MRRGEPEGIARYGALCRERDTRCVAAVNDAERRSSYGLVTAAIAPRVETKGMKMYAVIRQYDGLPDADEVARRATGELAPELATLDGFRAYWLVQGADATVVTITVCESKEAADASTSAAAEWVREHAADLVPNPPKVTAGEAFGA